jgi:hypothetical protein
VESRDSAAVRDWRIMVSYLTPAFATASTPNADSIDFFVVKKRMGHLLISVMILNIEISYHNVHAITNLHHRGIISKFESDKRV